MSRFFIAFLVICLILSSAEAGRKQDKAGTLTGSTYTDDTHQFSMTIHDNWRAKIGKESSPFRVILLQKNFSIPPDYLRAPDYTQQPKLVIWADTTNQSASAFIDSLLSDTYKSKQKSEVLKEFAIFEEGDELIPKGKKPVLVGGLNGLRWDAQSKYTKAVSTSASGTGGTRVQSSYGGSIIAVKSGKSLIAIHLICELPFYETVMSEVLSMVTSLQFTNSAPSAEKK